MAHNNNNQTRLIRITLLLLIVVASLLVYVFRDHYKSFLKYGYIGVLIINAITHSTVLIPVPGIIFTYGSAVLLDPLWITVAASSVATIGESSGYLAGQSGTGIINNTKLYKRIYNYLHYKPKLASLILILASMVPNPFFDLVGIASGSLKIPFHKFLYSVFIGNTIKMAVFAYAGQMSLPILLTP